MQPGTRRQLIKSASYVAMGLVVMATLAIILKPTKEPELIINSEIRENEDDMVAHMENELTLVTAPSRPADEAWRRVTVLCLVVTNSIFIKRAIAANETWGKRCDKLVIMSNNGNMSQNILPIYKPRKEKEGNPSAVSIMMALKYVLRNYGNNFDWFLHADDQTYVIMENLRYFLHRIKRQDEVFFMQETVKLPTKIATPPTGFVLNRKALEAFGKFQFDRLCAPIGVKPVPAIERCMRLLKVDKEEAIEGVGQGRYYGYDLGWSLQGQNNYEWPPKLNKSQEDVEYPIFYHGIQDRKFYTLDFLLYQARLWGERPNDSGEETRT